MIKYAIVNIDTGEYLDDNNIESQDICKAYLEDTFEESEEARKDFDEAYLYKTVAVKITYEQIAE